MKSWKLVLSTALMCSILPASQAADTPALNPSELRKEALELLGIIPDKMPGAEKDTPAMVELGKKLYFEKRLSSNESMSCNTCHDVENRKGGVDAQPTSPGAFGKRGDRNSPTVLNAGFQLAQFWDGRAETLEHQAKGPILNPIEMSMPDEKEVLKRLKADKDYSALFKKAFPAEADPLTYDSVAKAIAAFERTLVTRDRLDDFLKGSDAALSTLEQRGLKAFLTLGCTTCHHGPVIGGNNYQKSGLVNPYVNQKDLGRASVTKDEDDNYKFKVPMLRNIALTAPYFHDGKVATLEEAVRNMGWMQLGRKLTEDEVQSLVAFLKTLTDKQRVAKPSET